MKFLSFLSSSHLNISLSSLSPRLMMTINSVTVALINCDDVYVANRLSEASSELPSVFRATGQWQCRREQVELLQVRS